MRRVLVLPLLLAALLAGCRPAPSGTQSPHPPDSLSAAQLLYTMLSAAPEGAEGGLSTVLSPAGDDYPRLYGLNPDWCADYAIARLGGARVFELAVIRMLPDADIHQAGEALDGYRVSRQGDFTGYAPDQAKLAEEGGIANEEAWLALIISEDVGAVAEAFWGCLSGEIPPVDPPVLPPSAAPPVPADTPAPTDSPASTTAPTPSLQPTPEPTPTSEPVPVIFPGRSAFIDPGIDDMTLYDTSAILAAWETGHEEGLSDKDRAILRRCREVISARITDSMSPLQKEWAIYSWLTSRVDYDWTHYDPLVETPRESYEPYGPLLDGVGVCLGYAAAFQLFMDLLDIECITVVGAAFQSREDHAWNMVRLDGQWYCVDATWDNDSGGLLELCRYFNVTSRLMADTDHQWDYAVVPEATAKQNWKKLL